jgi:hypothetical protein
MKKLIRRLCWPSKRISDKPPAIQKDIDAGHGIRPRPLFEPDFYRRLSDAPQQQARWGELRISKC